LISQTAEFVVRVGFIVLENLTTIVLLKLPDGVPVVADLEIPGRRPPRVVRITARLVPPTLEVSQRVLPVWLTTCHSAASNRGSEATEVIVRCNDWLCGARPVGKHVVDLPLSVRLQHMLKFMCLYFLLELPQDAANGLRL
jgi:hypothetical protein